METDGEAVHPNRRKEKPRIRFGENYQRLATGLPQTDFDAEKSAFLRFETMPLL
jgi:hypothetical protein